MSDVTGGPPLVQPPTEPGLDLGYAPTEFGAFGPPPADAGAAPTAYAPVAPSQTPTSTEPWWKSRWFRFGLALILLVVAVLVFVSARGGKAAAGEIFLEASDQPGSQTFTPSIAEAPPGQLAPNAYEKPQPSSGGTIKTNAASPGLYGGQRDVPGCNAGNLVSYLEGNPNVARPWAGALGLSPASIKGYVATLTPALLRVDTRVTEFGLADGRAVPRQSILQAGTAVLLDRSAFPRVRCAGGNPLAEAQPVVSSPQYTGSRWPGFSPTTVVVITPAPTPPPVIILIDVVTGDPFGRIPGSIVIIDIDRPPAGADVLVVEQGEPMTFEGRDWPPGTAVEMLWDDPALIVGTDVADGAGNVRVAWDVPATAPVGRHLVTAQGGGLAFPEEVFVIPPAVRIL